MPLFTSSDSLETVWVKYRPLVYVVHHGACFKAGHYTTLTPDGAGFRLLDDNRAIKKASKAELLHASRNTYLMLLVLDSEPDPKQMDSQDLIVRPRHVGQQQCPTASQVRKRVGDHADEPHGITAQGASSADADAASSSGQAAK